MILYQAIGIGQHRIGNDTISGNWKRPPVEQLLHPRLLTQIREMQNKVFPNLVTDNKRNVQFFTQYHISSSSFFRNFAIRAAMCNVIRAKSLQWLSMTVIGFARKRIERSCTAPSNE